MKAKRTAITIIVFVLVALLIIAFGAAAAPTDEPYWVAIPYAGHYAGERSSAEFPTPIRPIPTSSANY